VTDWKGTTGTPPSLHTSSRAYGFDQTLAAIVFAGGFVWFFREWLFSGFDRIFGDDSDGEILIAIITHWNHVFSGQARWPDPIFFYPERGTLGYTDAMFLYGAAHSVLRVLGFDVFTAFMLVLASLSAIGFFGFLRLATHHFRFSMRWALVGAFLFTFANMNAAGLIHGQLYCAMLLPVLGDLALSAWQETRLRRRFILALGAGLLQATVFLTSFQTGWFFCLFLLLFALIHPFVFGLAASVALFRDAIAVKRTAIIGFALGFSLGIVPFLLLYLPVLWSGRHRELAEILSNTPDMRDILNVTPGNWMWGEVLRQFGFVGRPNRPWWELDLGFTPIVFVILVITTIELKQNKSPTERDRWMLLLGIAVLLSWLIQLEFFGWRPWTLIYQVLPGASGIRYTFRSQIVANLFASLVVAGAFHSLEANTRGRRRTSLLAIAAVIVLVEQGNIDLPPTISRAETIARISAVRSAPPECKVFYLSPGIEPREISGWIHQAHAMLFAELRNMPTINGYSSWTPDGWDLEEPAGVGYPAAVRDWAGRKRLTGLCGLDPARGAWTIGLP
jgi:hypothetical protein